MKLLLAGAGAVGVSMIGLGLSTWLPLSLALMFLAGWGTISMAATCNTLIQLRVPDVLRGRVASVYTTVFAGATPFGGLFSGALAALGGPPAALVLGGAIAIVAAAVGLLRVPGGTALGGVPVLPRFNAQRRR
jgi:hypothetical protein